MHRRSFLAGTAALAGATLTATPLAFAQGKLETTKVAIAVGGKNLFYYLPLTI
ncbi:MAG: ABC transporter substrate-binding protein, partial [Burkholderia sp.]|nr:ABC transporter substrate-binding protein [Burkholderia sp.]